MFQRSPEGFSRTRRRPELLSGPTPQLVSTIPTQGRKYNRHRLNPERKAMSEMKVRCRRHRTIRGKNRDGTNGTNATNKTYRSHKSHKQHKSHTQLLPRGSLPGAKKNRICRADAVSMIAETTTSTCLRRRGYGPFCRLLAFQRSVHRWSAEALPRWLHSAEQSA